MLEAKIACIQSLLENKSQWASVNKVLAAGRHAPIAVIQVLSALPQAEDNKAGHLMKFARMQTVTRKRAKIAAQGEEPLGKKTADGLLNMIQKLQGEDPLCSRLKKEIKYNKSWKGYEIDQDGLLRYKSQVIVLQQKALTQELLYLYHDNQFAGHWGIEKTKKLL
ncbi:hypothetical protein BDW72DRAFT_199782 [Aspergillus terricola var. indicus]